jgi:hypothetical protein
MTTKIEGIELFLKEVEEFFAPSRRAADKIRRQTLPGEERTRRALIAYSRGEICRGDVMDLLDIDWYGQLLDALAEHGIDRPDAHLATRATPLLKEILE